MGGLFTAQQLQAATGKSQPSISLALNKLGAEVCKLGAARSTRYALTAPILGLPARQNLTWTTPDGRLQTFGDLCFLQGGQVYVRSRMNGKKAADWLSPVGQLPWFLQTLRPDFPADPDTWRTEQVLYMAINHTGDPPGALNLGETIGRFLPEATSAVADQLGAGRAGGAWGSRRARAHRVESGERTYLVSERFDCVGLEGERHVVAASAVHQAFVATSPQNWVATCAALAMQKRLTQAHVGTVTSTYLFGQYIGNTDMHVGNLSFFVDDVLQPDLEPTPVYDMLPMMWRPGVHTGELDARPVQPQAQPAGYAALAGHVRTWAITYWERAPAQKAVGAPCDALPVCLRKPHATIFIAPYAYFTRASALICLSVSRYNAPRNATRSLASCSVNRSADRSVCPTAAAGART